MMGASLFMMARRLIAVREKRAGSDVGGCVPPRGALDGRRGAVDPRLEA